MKNSILLFFVIKVICSCEQNEINASKAISNNQVSPNYLASRDSIINENDHGSVYITKDTCSKLYSWLTLDKINKIEFNKLFDKSYIKNFKNKNRIEILNFDKIPILGEWCSIYFYKNQFFVYSPSDWMNDTRVLISDSAFYYLNSSDCSFESIQQFKIGAKGNLEFDLISAQGESSKLTIRFIEENITHWNYKTLSGIETNELRVNANHVKDFKMIVNDCFGFKCFQEFVFDDSKHLKLLKSEL